MERFGDKVAIVGVNNDDDHDAARKMIASQGMTWRSWQTRGTEDPINRRWRVNSWPTVYVLDGNGAVRYANVRGPYLEQAVTTLLAEPQSLKR